MRRPTISLTSCGRWLRPRRASVLRRSAILRKCARWSSRTSIESGADAGLHDRLLGRPHGPMRSPAVVCSGSLRFKPPLATCAARRAHDQASSEPIRRPSGRRTKGGLLGLDQMVEAGAGARVVPGARRKPGRAAEIRAGPRTAFFILLAKLNLRPPLAALEPGRCRCGPADGFAREGSRGGRPSTGFCRATRPAWRRSDLAGSGSGVRRPCEGAGYIRLRPVYS
jgi:hypothetical protein